MAPCLGSCDRRGTSRRRPPVTGSREPSLEVEAVAGTVADFEGEDEIFAVCVARRRSGVV